MTYHSQLDTLIASLGITYQATFIPFSKSRNAKPDPKISELSTNWKVALAKGGVTFETDYQQGIGHLPEPLKFQKTSYTIDEDAAIRRACERGDYYARTRPSEYLKGRPLPAPELRDVLYSLAMDTSVLDSASFEEWASESGHDADSRKAEQIYQACLTVALRLRQLIGDAQMSALREAFQNY